MTPSTRGNLALAAFDSARRRARIGGHRFDDRVAEVLGAEFPLGSARVPTYSINVSVITRVP
jgi:hypothetical protein